MIKRVIMHIKHTFENQISEYTTKGFCASHNFEYILMDLLIIKNSDFVN